MEEKKKKRSLLTRFFCSGYSLTFLGAVLYLLLFGFEIIAATLVAVSFGGLATTSAVASEGVFEFLSTLIELFVEGISSIFDAIASLFSF